MGISRGSQPTGPTGAAGQTGVGNAQKDYAQIIVDATISGSPGSPTTLITGAAVSYDGSTRVRIEVYTAVLFAGSQAAGIEIYEDGVSLGRVIQVNPNTANSEYGVIYRTPTAGSHTYVVKGWVNGGTNATFSAASGTYMPAYLRVTTAP